MSRADAVHPAVETAVRVLRSTVGDYCFVVILVEPGVGPMQAPLIGSNMDGETTIDVLQRVGERAHTGRTVRMNLARRS